MNNTDKLSERNGTEGEGRLDKSGFNLQYVQQQLAERERSKLGEGERIFC